LNNNYTYLGTVNVMNKYLDTKTYRSRSTDYWADDAFGNNSHAADVSTK